MSAPDPIGTSSVHRGWHYHSQEIVVRPATRASCLPQDLVRMLSETREVGWVDHGASVSIPSTVAAHKLEVNGQRSQYLRQGHLDLPLQRTLLADADLAVVVGNLETVGPCVVELPPPDGSEQDLSLLGLGPGAILFGQRRPVLGVPAGGVAWFEPAELPDLVEHLLELLERRLRERPLWGLALLGASTPVDAQSWLNALSARCERLFVATEGADGGYEAAPDHHPRLADLGRILSCLEAHPDAAFLVGGGAFAPDSEAALDSLLQGRDPYRVATAIREVDTHLPRRLPSIWEPKSRLRIHPALAAEIRCSQRVLTHSRIQLLEPLPVS